MKVVFMFLTSNDVNDELDSLCRLLKSRNMKVFMNDKPKHVDNRMVHVGFNLDYEVSRNELKQLVSHIGSGIASKTTTPEVVLPGDAYWKSKYNNM